MGNCTGANVNPKSKPIKSLGKENLQDQENHPPTSAAHTPRSKITLEQATRKREALRLNLMEQSLDPPVFFVHKIEPLSKKYAK